MKFSTVLPTPDFKGHLDPISSDIEVNLWRAVDVLADKALANYGVDANRTKELLEINESQKLLSDNQRNCLVYIRGERKVLNFLKDCAAKALKVLKMNKVEAANEVNSWEDCENIIAYFRHTIINQLLPDGEPEGDVK